MKLSKILSKEILFITTGIIISIILICYTIIIFKNNSAVVHAQSIQSMRLRIPTIGVDANIESLGLTTSGAMDAPKDIGNAGIYNLGTMPGEIGSAVIDGHSGWLNGVPAVFNNLNKIKNGDLIYFENTNSEMLTFKVRETKIYNENEHTVDVFSSEDNKSHLNLITCDGTWNEDEGGYTNRLVVFSDLQNSL